MILLQFAKKILAHVSACFIFLKIQKLFCITFDLVDFTGIVCFKTKLGETERNRRPGLKYSTFKVTTLVINRRFFEMMYFCGSAP